MVRVKRLEEMLKYIETNGSVSLDELCEVFQISKNTARRDIDEVLKTGTIKKIYGGVSFITPEIKEPPRTSYSLRSADNMAESGPLPDLLPNRLKTATVFLLMREPPPAVLSNLSKIRKSLP